jgi:ribonucleotide reductase beta subunit family protein with ferritin-like domain
MSKKQPRIKTHTDSYVTYYPQFVEFANTQLEKCFWTANEIAMEKDKQDMLVNMTDAERHAVTTALKLFVKYEIFVGTEYWMTRVMNTYPRPEIQRMAAVFGMMELGVHAPFYNKLNEVLGLNTDEFYTSYIDDPVLNDRVQFLESLVDSSDELLSLAVFSMLEGAVLFSSFAMFKNFQSNGNNLISNTVRGISQSLIDEGLHQQAGAALFKQVVKESKLKAHEWEDLYGKIEQAAQNLLDHEERIIDMFFEKGPLRGVTAEQMKAFVAHRVNVCMDALGVKPCFEVNDNTVESWFYTSAQGYQQVDFFTGIGREYQRGWNEKAFEWEYKETE